MSNGGPAADPPPEEMAAVRLRHSYEHRDEDFWAWDRLQGWASQEPERAWPVILALVARAPDERLEYVAAGPLETVLERHGAAFVDRAEAEARRDPRFREPLAGIWLVEEDIPPDVLRRLQEATGGRILVATQAEIDEAAERAERELFDRDA